MQLYHETWMHCSLDRVLTTRLHPWTNTAVYFHLQQIGLISITAWNLSGVGKFIPLMANEVKDPRFHSTAWILLLSLTLRWWAAIEKGKCTRRQSLRKGFKYFHSIPETFPSESQAVHSAWQETRHLRSFRGRPVLKDFTTEADQGNLFLTPALNPTQQELPDQWGQTVRWSALWNHHCS